jgi:hypothetical protein
MKLTNLYTGKRLITEGRVDPNVLLSLQNIIKQGQARETMQFIVLARLIEFFKNGYLYKTNNFYDPFLSTSGEMLKQLRGLKPEEQVELAKKMLELAEIKDKDLLYSFVNPTQETLLWIQWATKREAND